MTEMIHQNQIYPPRLDPLSDDEARPPQGVISHPREGLVTMAGGTKDCWLVDNQLQGKLINFKLLNHRSPRTEPPHLSSRITAAQGI